MEINSLFNNAAADPKQPVNNPKTQLGKEDFLKLLTVQLRYQDPMNPLENTEFIAQMSQFSSLEQLQNMNQTLGQNLESENRLHTAFMNNIATSLIGKNVEIPTREIEYNGDDPAILTYRLGEGTHKASAQILDARGQLVRSLVLDSSSSHGSVSWDGKSQVGTEVPAGVYRLSYRRKAWMESPWQGRSSRVCASRQCAIWVGRQKSGPMAAKYLCVN